MSVHTPHYRSGWPTQVWLHPRPKMEPGERKTGREGGGINQAGPQTPAAGRLAGHEAPESWNHLVPGPGCRTLATPAGPVKQHRSSKHRDVWWRGSSWARGGGAPLLVGLQLSTCGGRIQVIIKERGEEHVTWSKLKSEHMFKSDSD